jgi:hypothetical protein
MTRNGYFKRRFYHLTNADQEKSQWSLQVFFDPSKRQIDPLPHALIRLWNIMLPILLHGPGHDNERTVGDLERLRLFHSDAMT